MVDGRGSPNTKLGVEVGSEEAPEEGEDDGADVVSFAAMIGGSKTLPIPSAGALLLIPTNTPNIISNGRRKNISKQIHFHILFLRESSVGRVRAVVLSPALSVVLSASLPLAESPGWM